MGVHLASNRVTQNLSLLSLFKWKPSSGQLSEMLNRLTFVDTVEIVRFLPETLAALFAIIESGEAQPGYDALIHVLSLLGEAKTYNYKYPLVLLLLLLLLLTLIVSCLLSGI